MFMDNILRIQNSNGEFKQIGDIWQRGLEQDSTKGATTTFSNTRIVDSDQFTPTKVMPSLKAFGNQGKRKADKLFGRYVPFYSVDQTTYPYRVEESGQIKVSCIDTVSTPNKFGYLNTATNEFVEVAGMGRYRRVEYIESHGTERINTGITGACNVKAKAKYAVEKASTRVLFVVTITSSVGTWLGSTGGDNNVWGTGVGGGRSTIPATTKADLNINFANAGVTATINEEEVSTATTATIGTLYAFSSSRGDYGSEAQLEFFTVKQNDVLVRDYVPVYDTVNNVYGMWDRVKNEFYGNNGTGAFTGGTDYLDTIVPVEYIESNGTEYIDTGYKVASENIEINTTLEFTSLPDKSIVCGSQVSNNSTFGGLLYYRTDYGGFGACMGNSYSNGTYSSVSTNTKYAIKHTANNGNGNVQVNGIDHTASYTGTLITNLSWFIFFSHTGSSTTANVPAIAKMYGISLTDNNTLVRDYIPVRIGTTGYMLDLVEYKLYANAGTGAFAYGEDVPYSLLCPEIITVNRGDVKFGQYGKNLFDIANADIVDGAYITDDGSINALPTAVYTGAYIRVKPNTTYTWSGKDGDAAINYAICEYDADKTFIERHSRHTSLDDDTWTTKGNTYFLRFNLKKSDTRTTLQLEEGSTATAYEPYHFGLHADGEHTLSLDGTEIANISSILPSTTSYEDVQTGQVYKDWEFKVFDGTETWTLQSINQYGIANFSIPVQHPYYDNMSAVCNKFDYQRSLISDTKTPGFLLSGTTIIYIRIFASICSTVNAFKAYLAEQYEKGTPVIILYPLATPQTSSVTAQTVSLTDKAQHTASGQAEMDVQTQAKYLGL